MGELPDRRLRQVEGQAVSRQPAPGAIRALRRAYTARLVEPWAYLGPAVLLISLVMLVPLAIGISYAFRNMILLRPGPAEWVGL